MPPPRIYLSSPHMGGDELKLVQETFASNWIAPLGPQVDAFEKEFAARAGTAYAAALTSGTAALHLALRWLNLQPGDEVLCSTFTFSASVNPILYERATPVFVDSDERSWNMDPQRLAEAIADGVRRGHKPKAVVLVHLYGQSADIDPIAALCAQHGIPLIEDAAEALGAVYYGSQGLSVERSKLSGAPSAQLTDDPSKTGQLSDGSYGLPDPRTGNQEPITGNSASQAATNNPQPVTNNGTPRQGVAPGSVGLCGVHSFNGNKIITTSGGGMLVSNDAKLIEKARFWATQSRDQAPHYQHSEVGFNYRMSNVLAAIGRGQLRVLEQRVDARRRNCAFYQASLGNLPGLSFMPEAPFGRCTRWLTCITIDPAIAGTDREKVRLALAAENIEARPVWKPMHLQPIFKDCRCYGGEVTERLFSNGLCLPSGSNLTEADLGRVVEGVRGAFRR